MNEQKLRTFKKHIQGQIQGQNVKTKPTGTTIFVQERIRQAILAQWQGLISETNPSAGE